MTIFATGKCYYVSDRSSEISVNDISNLDVVHTIEI